MQYLCTPIVRWCKGSTADFGSAGPGSNPGRTTVRKLSARGHGVPSFVEMIKKEDIAQVAEKYLADQDMFVVKLTVSRDNLINVYIDGDHGVTIDDCVNLSRHLEHQFDREVEDYELRVSSPGAGQPFLNFRQYKKNIGRQVEVTPKEGKKIKGELVEVTESFITVKEEIKSKNKKNKKTVTGKPLQIPMDSIKQTKTVITF